MSQGWEPSGPGGLDEPGGPRPRGAAVTVLAVTTMILGFLQTFCCLCGLGSLSMLPEMLNQMRENPSVSAEQMRQLEEIQEMIDQNRNLITAQVVLGIVTGVLMIVGGLGLLNRKAWARILVLVIAFLSGALGGLAAVQQSWLFAAINIGYCVWALAVLLNERNAAEFS